MVLKLSKRSDVESFRALTILSEVAERRAAGEDIITLAPGQPCFGAPQIVLQKAKDFIDQDPIQGYTAAIGTLPLRKRIAKYYKENYDHIVHEDQIVVTTSSSSGFILSLLSVFDAGDTVALTMPTYPAYKNMLQALDINVVEIETTKEINYQPTADLLEKTGKKFDGIIITNPSNPTGAMIDKETLKGICKWCDANDVRLISDEAYHGITYEQKAQTVLPFSKNVIVLNTFSKYFALTGWRLGWAILPEDMIIRIKKLAENLFVSPPTISQFIAMEVFEHTNVLDGYVAKYKENRNILRKRLPEIGFDDFSSAQGAFYLYVDISNLTNNSEDFCRRMLDEAKVAITPGMDFDTKRGNSTIRISYAGDASDMHEACDRLIKWQKIKV
ncbi:MAG: aminotransferase class I/II-fold pyridoxal phosphate-dependent enzyme [Alphaproteobacteria bacterium]|nr:aminotransferase class I/II-fold pyridoxal phosphate-dependent enzyme [Alphaproteobacteria bacterium]